MPAAVLLVLVLVTFQLPFSGWVGHNGDHFYYGSMALQFDGWSYDRATSEVSSYFHYWHPARALDWGYLNPQVAPLIYPRTVLPLAAVPFVAVSGIAGVWVPGVICGIVTLLVLARLCQRRFGPVAMVSVVVLALFSRLFTEFGFGIYTESFVLLLLTLMLLVLPLDDARRSWRYPAIVGLLVALLFFVRQVALFPLAAIGLAWLGAWLSTRAWRNAWLPFLLVATGVTAVMTAVFARWAPYDPLLFLDVRYHASSAWELLPRLPGPFFTAMNQDAVHALRVDRLTLLLPLLATVGGYRLRRTAWPWLAAGAVLAGFVTTALNGLHSDFRYLAPALPFVLVLAAVGVVDLCERASQRLGVAPAEPREPRRPDVSVHASWLALVAASLALVAVVGGTLLAYRPQPLRGAASREVSAARWGASWPLRDTSGTLLCTGGDAEVWFRAADGRLYAFSGTAMARSLTAPRLTSEARTPVTSGWPAATQLLAAGVALCRTPRGG